MRCLVVQGLLLTGLFLQAAAETARADIQDAPQFDRVASSRVDPLRLLRSARREATTTHAQTEKSPRSLSYRGIQPAAASGGVVHTSTQRQLSEDQRRFGVAGPVAADQTLRSVADQTATNQALFRAARERAFRQVNHRLQANGAPDLPALRSRVSNTGVDPASTNARLGRSLNRMGGTPDVARHGSARLGR